MSCPTVVPDSAKTGGRTVLRVYGVDVGTSTCVTGVKTFSQTPDLIRNIEVVQIDGKRQMRSAVAFEVEDGTSAK